MAEVRLVPCLSDNYAVIVCAGDETILIDAPEAAPIADALKDLDRALTTVLITHHHKDHVQGLEAVRGSAKVIGPAAEAGRIDGLDRTVEDGERFAVGGIDVVAITTPGHTSGPASYHMPELGLAFTGDTLFAMGCGRLFEGDAPTMWRSLQALRTALPDETVIYCGHEYTLTNARFASQALPKDPAIAERLALVEAARDKGEPTVPTTMALEKATNPFLRADEPETAAALDLAARSPEDVFAHLRAGRDRF